MDKKTIASGVIGIVAISGGVDASILNERPIPLTEVHLKEEVVTLEQKGNVIESRMPWKDQVGIKVKYDLGEPTIAERLADKREKGIITETVDIDDGGFKIDVLLNEKPNTNVFCYTIEGAENYDFFYQPPLTAEEIAEGASRPEEIVGSYAVYHKTLANHRIGGENYATGKVMHIPFPYVWEVNASSTTRQRAENMTYEDGQLCITVQQDFLDNATYPVRVDPTFGYTTAGASTSGGIDVIVATTASLSENGDVTKISVNFTSGTWTAGEEVQVAIYDSSLNYVADSDEVTTGGADFQDFPISASLNAGTYSLAEWQDDAITIRADSGQPANSHTTMTGQTYTPSNPSWPASITKTSTFIKSIYATYTATGGGSTPQGEEVIFFE